MDQGTLIDVQPESDPPAVRRSTSKGIGAGDIVLIDKKGRQRVGYPYEVLTSNILLSDLRALEAER